MTGPPVRFVFPAGTAPPPAALGDALVRAVERLGDEPVSERDRAAWRAGDVNMATVADELQVPLWRLVAVFSEELVALTGTHAAALVPIQ